MKKALALGGLLDRRIASLAVGSLTAARTRKVRATSGAEGHRKPRRARRSRRARLRRRRQVGDRLRLRAQRPAAEVCPPAARARARPGVHRSRARSRSTDSWAQTPLLRSAARQEEPSHGACSRSRHARSALILEARSSSTSAPIGSARRAPPDEVVARARADQVGWQLPPPGRARRSARSPSRSAADHSIYLHDSLNDRMLVWNAGDPDTIVRSVPLPDRTADNDVALGPEGLVST